uniref:HAMP domain-containing sensor histidine kinase n=1 Tax=Agathobacter sp. TaxID=2021311 RepID=UPI0040560232
MDREKLEQIKKRELRRHALVARLGGIFFWVIISFGFLLMALAYIATKMGFTMEGIPNPLIFVWIITSLCITLAMMSSFYLIHRIFTPLEELSKASIKVAEGDFSVQLEYDGHLNELTNTIENFNRMVKELNSVEIMRNDFVADVSHEFKTPLAAITGYTTFLQDPELTEEERDAYIRKIHFNVDKLNELTENILRLSKLEHQQFLDEPVTFRLDEQIREAIVLLEPKWGRKNINFDLELPEICYRGQKGLLFQIWMNIIGNAIKYTDSDGEVQVILKEEVNCYEVYIRDNGIGMSEETLSHIFDKFYQGDTSRKSQGNGLGLALCKEIIKKCNGAIVVESTIGVGSVFLVKLPKNEK